MCKVTDELFTFLSAQAANFSFLNDGSELQLLLFLLELGLTVDKFVSKDLFFQVWVHKGLQVFLDFVLLFLFDDFLNLTVLGDFVPQFCLLTQRLLNRLLLELLFLHSEGLSFSALNLMSLILDC